MFELLFATALLAAIAFGVVVVDIIEAVTRTEAAELEGKQ